MRKPVWILKSAVLAVQEELLFEHGGLAGIRDEGLLDSALARPQQLFSYGGPDLFDMAAAYTNGIVRNHPFVDGNKRAVFVTGAIFLERNGKRLAAPEAEATQAVLDLAAGKMTEKEFAIWLKENCE
ncbi:MAG: type II toxin-antitoxin system death-on-curing family toxin [Nitrospinae bacterium]|nr:type II toxin-antitoxin system death-on-curing family toxin [Nitrospinota bacterium]